MREDTPKRGPHTPESVWEYPRPPRVEASARQLRVVFADEIIAQTERSLRVLETSHPPVYYIPLGDVHTEVLVPSPRRTWCEYKGEAAHYDVVLGERRAPAAAWHYPQPAAGYEVLFGHVAFYPGRMDACYVDDELVTAQEGDFYGGWITREIVGPFKGAPGTRRR
jgi:uncharacterized protein (DUF427 family)